MDRSTPGNRLMCRGAAMENEPPQDALFQIEGPDEDGCVWACSSEGRDIWCHNLGPKEKVAGVLGRWLRSVEEKSDVE
jgi:hypothetical protein